MDNLFNRVARRRLRGQSGFTLIELLVVIAVLAILALIVLFNVLGVANKGKSSSCNTDEQTIQTAVDSYYNDTGKYPDGNGDTATPGNGDPVDTAELQSGSYIHSQPNTSVDGAFTYTGTGATFTDVTAANCPKT